MAASEIRSVERSTDVPLPASHATSAPPSFTNGRSSFGSPPSLTRTSIEQTVAVDPRRTLPSLQAPRMVLGPVIGTVTHSTARIMVEMASEGPVSCCLRVQGAGFHRITEVRRTLLSCAGAPVVFKFDGLEPATHYNVLVEGCIHPHSSFRTFPEEPSLQHRLTFAIVGDNEVSYSRKHGIQPAGDLWQDLAKRIAAQKVDLVIHIGGQVHADLPAMDVNSTGEHPADPRTAPPFARAMVLLQEQSERGRRELRQEILEMYRNLYREAWQYPTTRDVLANCPNLMIFAEAELRSCLGLDVEDSDVHSASGFVLSCARQVALEYMWQLHCDSSEVNSRTSASVTPQKENHFALAYGDYGILAIDTVGARVFRRNPRDHRPLCTSEQWESIHASLSADGVLARCKLLLCVSQTPVVLFAQKELEKIGPRLGFFEWSWWHRANNIEQMELMEALWMWKRQRPNRLVVLASGGIGKAGYSQILFERRPVVHQIVVGPVANAPTGLMENVTDMLSRGELIPLGKDWTFEHFGWPAGRSYGLVGAVGSTSSDQPATEETVVGLGVMHVIGKEKSCEELTPARSSCECNCAIM